MAANTYSLPDAFAYRAHRIHCQRRLNRTSRALVLRNAVECRLRYCHVLALARRAYTECGTPNEGRNLLPASSWQPQHRAIAHWSSCHRENARYLSRRKEPLRREEVMRLESD